MIRAKNIAKATLTATEIATISTTGVGIGLPFTLTAQTVSGTTAYALTAPFKFEVLDGHFIMGAAGGASDTIVMKNGSTAITDTSDLSAKSDKEIVRFTTIDDAQSVVAKDATFSFVTASDSKGLAVAHCIRRE